MLFAGQFTIITHEMQWLHDIQRWILGISGRNVSLSSCVLLAASGSLKSRDTVRKIAFLCFQRNFLSCDTHWFDFEGNYYEQWHVVQLKPCYRLNG